MSIARAPLLLALLTPALACAHAPAVATPGPPAELKSPYTGYRSMRYADPAQWLCLPGREGDLCRRNLDATELRADGSRALVPEPLPNQAPAIDCFYVYPTVDMSLGPANHTDFTDTQPMAEATLAQVAHFRSVCNLYVPLYRQVTIGTYFRSPEKRESYLAVAESDVADAFLHYLGQYNQGRRFVLIGHSQGAEMIVRVLKRYIDGDPVLRARMLVALPIGGNVDVPRGQLVGGTFEHLPLCSGADDLGCIVAYRSIVAGAEGATRDTRPPGEVSACVNPTALGGPPKPTSRTYLLVTDRLRSHIRGAEDVTTPFVMLRDFYRAECVEGPPNVFSLAMSEVHAPGDARANPIDFGARLFHGELGLHLVDFQLTQGDLIDLVARRAAKAAAP